MRRSRFLARCLAIALAAAALPVPALSQIPQLAQGKAVRLIVPYAAGGLPDTVARILAPFLTDALGVPVVVDNRSGAGGAAAMAALEQAQPDGSAFLLTDGPLLAVAPYLKMGRVFESAAGLLPVSVVGTAPLYLAVNPRLGAATLDDLVHLARAHPGRLTYGSSGLGSIHHLTAEAMAQALGIRLTHVPFRGSSASVPAMIAGTVDMVFASPPSLMGFVRNGQARILAVNSVRRSAQLPDVPALAERIDGFDFAFTVAVLAKAGTTADIIAQMSRSIAQAVRVPRIAEQLRSAGVDALGSSPREAASRLRAETSRMAGAAQAAGMRVER
ncbi:MAG TPA: tripartite tricarboxylate transporter substrate binding protein [Ramlibacter sp.]|uniref:tripartite tricarboxylate transporter substrate binding protein n=1 Tax=Ramlibacter sp. TaxID=1917967 RepID=UPI002BF526E4|nr:tripartite tricarboxylate transporter substrate binding protein [Ramlibacter sp.]HVZ45068.1 tripartite tricarboxylate transporter substrate binding protein [Ramlibacter sp.]